MTILNQASDGLYAELIAVFRAAAEFGPISSDDLVRVCSVGESTRVKSVLTRWHSMGLFVTADGQVRLAPSVKRKRGETLDELTDRLPLICRALVLAPDNCLPLWGANGVVTEEGTGGCADFVRGLSWALAQDIYLFRSTSESAEAVEEEERRQRASAFIFLNKTRWPALRFWSRYLGFATGDEGAFFLDPTIAVREALSAAFGDGLTLPASAFIQALSDQLPVLDLGRYRREIEGILNPSRWQPQPAGHLSTSLSFALRRLQMDGTLELPFKDDAGSGLALIGRAGRVLHRFTHVVLRRTS
jgi:hypothetical protein